MALTKAVSELVELRSIVGMLARAAEEGEELEGGDEEVRSPKVSRRMKR